MKYDFLVESYASERVKVLSVWKEFRDEDLSMRPRSDDPRGRSVRADVTTLQFDQVTSDRQA
jgi:hypothetical protein